MWAAQIPPTADLREAARLDREGKCAESEPIYRKALAAQAPTLALLNNAGNHYLACGDATKAREYFEFVVRRSPSHINANLQLARLAVERRQPAEAFLRVLTGQSDPALWVEAGGLYARAGDFRNAQQAFQKVAAARPGDFDALWNLGRAAARAGDLERARDALESALRLKPGDAGALLELGLAHAASGDAPRAVFLLAQAESKAPAQPGVALALARAAEDAGYYGDAAAAYERHLKQQPSDAAARRDHARVLALAPGGRERGLRLLEEYGASHPTDPVAHFQLAQLTWETNPEQSLDRLDQAVKLDPKLAPAHTARAWLLHRLGRDGEALPHLDAALKVTPDDVRALDLRGLVLVGLERVAEAEKTFRRAAAVAPSDWEVRLHLGRALMEQGREQEARVWLDQYQKLRPARQRDARREPGMIELATLPAAERRARQIERFQTMAAARPDDALLRLHLASLLLTDGREAEATRQFASLLEANPDEATLVEAGRVLLDARRYEWALPFLEKAGRKADLALAQFHAMGADRALKTLADSPEEGEALVLKAEILDGAGLLDKVAAVDVPPRVAGRAALLLARHSRYKDAARLLARAPGSDRGLALSEAVVLALDGRTDEAMRRLQRIEERWPEWPAPYKVHALLLSGSEAARKARTAAALGGGAADARCQTLRQWLQPVCRGDAE